MGKRKVKNLPVEGMSRREKFIEKLGRLRRWKEAALEAGYSKSYAETIEYRMKRNSKFMDELIRRYGANASVARLPRLQSIRDQVYDLVEKNPEKEKDYKHVFKTDLQMAGVLNDNQPEQQTTINIQGIQQLMVHLGERRRKQLEADAVDAEIDEDSD